ncbi:hypothetical protein RF11_15633 [Thelohanellus kitauei]|uniref:Uncharacterized protein n=1 Tax=Thelohanellus kitauei TaxID=669202 RepID=A0A0C2J611_THEKT|nr:hypothetical protein RF11_15633 [Thelohanellus kitauei]
MELENYDYDIEYIPGKTNSIADVISIIVVSVSLQFDIDICKSRSQDPETMKIVETYKNLQPSSYQIVDRTVFYFCRNGTVPYIYTLPGDTVLDYAHDIGEQQASSNP